MQQIASVLMNRVAWDALHHGNFTSCAPQLTFGHSDTLVARHLGASNRGSHWLEWVRAHTPDVVVLGATSHIYGLDNYTSILREVARAAATLPKGQPTLVWATSTPGGCGPGPLPRLTGM